MNDRSVRVLSERQDATIALLCRLLIVLAVRTIVAMIGMLVVCCDLLQRRKGWSEEMMHPMRRGCSKKKPERSDDGQM